MFTRIAIAAVLLSAGTLLAEEKMEFNTPAAWNSSTAKYAKVADGNLVVAKCLMMISGKPFKVDPAKTYTLSLQVKSDNAAEKVWTCAGFACYDIKGRFISAINSCVVKGSDTVMLEAAKKGDTVIKVKDASKWSRVGYAVIALNTKPDYSDLPNFDLISTPVASTAKAGEVWTVTLKKPLTKDIAAGTAIRQMAGGGYLYTAGNTKAGAEFVTLKGSISGFGKSGYDRNLWPAGTVTAAVLILNNWDNKKAAAVYKDISVTVK